MRSLVVFLSILAVGSSAPLQDNVNNRLLEDSDDNPSTSGENDITSGKTNSVTKDVKSSEALMSILAQDPPAKSSASSDRHRTETGRNKVAAKKGRKHKAIFVNYPLLAQLPFASLPNYDLDYSNDPNVEQRTRGGSNRYQESNIFYIRLPPTPYMFVPGLGYISQPPTYSTAGLRPQLPYVRPTRRPIYQQAATNPFINLPIDFVSNGKPTSVYQWQKKPSKKPLADSPITNLENLSADFVSNGKPTSIYQWQAGLNLKPAKRPDDSLNTLDKGPYTFNGKPTSFYLLKPDGTSTGHQNIRYQHDYQQDSSYY